MTSLKIFLLCFFCSMFIANAQQYSTIAVKQKWYKRPAFTISAPSAICIGYGLSVFGKHELLTSSYKVREYRNQHYPNFHTRADDYLVYGGAAAAITLNLCGVKTKNNWKNQLINYAASLVLANCFVQPLKYSTRILRPDSSTRNSFPSGHTTAAFVGAEVFHQEMKANGWGYSVAGYTLAASVGCMRMLNNRHWFSDVLVGAGIGMFSTKLVYFVREKMQQKKKKKVVVP